MYVHVAFDLADEKQEMKWKLETNWKQKLETETGKKLEQKLETQPLSCYSLSKLCMLLAIPELFLLPVFASLASFPCLCHHQYFYSGKYWGRQWLGMRLLYRSACVK